MELMNQLEAEFVACSRRYALPLGDFPNVNKFRRKLKEIRDISKFAKLDKVNSHILSVTAALCVAVMCMFQQYRVSACVPTAHTQCVTLLRVVR
jgi:Domain of unknown function (DUF5600)